MITMNLFQIRYVHIFALNNLEILRRYNSIQNEIKLKTFQGKIINILHYTSCIRIQTRLYIKFMVTYAFPFSHNLQVSQISSNIPPKVMTIFMH